MRELLNNVVTRYAGRSAIAVLIAMTLLAFLAPEAFTPIAIVPLLVAPTINWIAYRSLNTRLNDVPANRDIESLKKDVRASFIRFLGTSVTMVLGLFVVARAFHLVPMIPKEIFLVGLTYYPVIAVIPSLDTLATVAKLEKEAGRESRTRGT